MRKILLFTILITSTFYLQAQRFDAALVAGLTLSQVDGDLMGGFSKGGFQGGLRATINFTERIKTDLSILYSQRGSRPSPNEQNLTGNFWRMQLNYVTLPVEFKYCDWESDDGEYMRVFAKLGLAYGYLISVDQTQDSPWEGRQDDFNQNDFSYTFGIGYYINQHFILELSGQSSLLSYYKPEVGTGAENLRSRYIAIQLQYEF